MLRQRRPSPATFPDMPPWKRCCCTDPARGKASSDSCLDIAILLAPNTPEEEQSRLTVEWQTYYAQAPVFERLCGVGKYSHVDLEFRDGCFAPGQCDWTTGPDPLELEVGNLIQYGVPLWEGGAYLEQLKARWLPYYDEELRRHRLAEARKYCLNNLHHIPPYVARGLYFQAFYRLTTAFQEFMQALFIAYRRYPLAYNKWIREQVDEILELPEIYDRLPRLFEIRQLESDELSAKAYDLEVLLETYAVEQPLPNEALCLANQRAVSALSR